MLHHHFLAYTILNNSPLQRYKKNVNNTPSNILFPIYLSYIIHEAPPMIYSP